MFDILDVTVVELLLLYERQKEPPSAVAVLSTAKPWLHLLFFLVHIYKFLDFV